MQLKEAVKDVKLHGIKCYNIAARGIKHLAYSKELSKLGVVR
jgi:lipid A disaccharide synthetase